MPQDHDVFLTARQVRARYGNVSHMWIDRRLNDDPEFPRPTYFGRHRFWKLAALESWERARAAGKKPEAA